jgi:hypothetical protein
MLVARTVNRASSVEKIVAVPSVQSVFGVAMRSCDRLVGSPSRRNAEQFHKARFIRIARGAFAVWLDPFGMLNPQMVVNLLPKLGVGVDLVRHSHWPGERFKCGARGFV